MIEDQLPIEMEMRSLRDELFYYNRYISCHLDRSAPDCFPPAAYQRLERFVSYNTGFGKAVEALREKGNIRLGWLFQELGKYLQSYDLPYKKARDQFQAYYQNHRLPDRPLPSDTLRHLRERKRFRLPALEKRREQGLRQVVRQMYEKLPRTEVKSLLRKFRLPEDDRWVDAVEWWIHTGELVAVEDKSTTQRRFTSDCYPLILSVEKPYLGRSVNFNDEGLSVKEGIKGVYREKRFCIRIDKGTRQKDVLQVLAGVRHYRNHVVRPYKETLTFPLTITPFLHSAENGPELYLWLPEKFGKNDFMKQSVWEKVKRAQARLPGEVSRLKAWGNQELAKRVRKERERGRSYAEIARAEPSLNPSGAEGDYVRKLDYRLTHS